MEEKTTVCLREAGAHGSEELQDPAAREELPSGEDRQPWPVSQHHRKGHSEEAAIVLAGMRMHYSLSSIIACRSSCRIAC